MRHAVCIFYGLAIGLAQQRPLITGPVSTAFNVYLATGFRGLSQQAKFTATAYRLKPSRTGQIPLQYTHKDLAGTSTGLYTRKINGRFTARTF
jgi:hypothetical protein